MMKSKIVNIILVNNLNPQLNLNGLIYVYRMSQISCKYILMQDIHFKAKK